MTDKKDSNNSNSTLTLKPSTLQLKTGNAEKIKQNFAQGRSKNVTVEVVVKNRVRGKSPLSPTNDDLKKQQTPSNDPYKNSSLTEEERNNRFAALKIAANLAQIEAEENERILAEEKIKQEELLKKKKEKNLVNEQSEIKVLNLQKNVVNESNNPINEEKKTSSFVKTAQNLEIQNPKSKTTPTDYSESDNHSKKIVKEEVKTSAKSKWEEGRRNSGKISVNTHFEKEDERTRSLASIKRARAKAKRELIHTDKEKITREVVLPEVITVQDLANRMAERVTDVTKELMKMGIIATANQTIDADTAEIIADILGHKVKRVTESDIENIMIEEEDDEQDLLTRPPVVTIMGHVDHGKTSLLDALRLTDVVSREAGGITQHIGAYQITLANGANITFLDTPGHEAFTAMRARGAKATDIVVLVVAADDGIKAQTIEAINHAKAASVPIIVAINKIDKPEKDIARVKEELLSHELVAEEYGGDIIIVEVSAKAKINLDKLEEAILLQSEILNLRANPNRNASGVVVESKIDKNRGVVATVLVQKGTLKVGDLIVAGLSYGKIRTIHNDKAKAINLAIPSMPVEILGLSSAPVAGENFGVVSSEKQAREITEFRLKKEKELKTTAQRRGSIDELFSKSSKINKELAIIIKADVQGSLEAIVGSLNKFVNEEVKIKILHQAVGGINESDISLAKASNAIILGFNVRASANAKEHAEKDHIDLRYYSIIYNLIDDVKAALSGMLSPIIREEYLGSAVIRQIFNITKAGKIAGSFVTKGLIKRGSKVRLLRDNIVIHEGKLKTLRRFKEEVKEVKENFECGIAFENYEDIRENDTVEVFEIIEEKQVLA